MKKIAIINNKGGVGKTTTTFNLGYGLSLLNKKVLLVDTDPQSNLTKCIKIKNINKTLFDLLEDKEKKEISLKEVIYTIKDNLFIIPSNIKLTQTEKKIASDTNDMQYYIQDALDGIKNLDYILFDCMPSLSILNTNVLTYCNNVIIPLQVEMFSLQGLSNILDFINGVKKRLNTNLIILGILCTFVHGRRKISKEILNKIKKSDVFVFKNSIKDTTSIKNAQSKLIPIFEFDNNCVGSKDYMKLAKEIIASEDRIY